MKTISVVFALALCACPPVPPVGPPLDASDADADASHHRSVDAAITVLEASVTVVDAAPAPPAIDAGDQADQVCAHLAVIGCTQPSTCAATIRSKQGVFTDFRLSCLLGAVSAGAASSCGTVTCATSAAKTK